MDILDRILVVDIDRAAEKVPYQGLPPDHRVTHLERDLAEAKQEAEAQRISAEIKAKNKATVKARKEQLLRLHRKANATCVLLADISALENQRSENATFQSECVKEHLADMRALSNSLGYDIVVTASGSLSLVFL